MQRLFVVLLFLVASAGLPGGVLGDDAIRPVTHEDLWTMRRLGAPVPSPDGEWIVVSVTEPDYDEDAAVSDLWLIAADGDPEPRRLTSSRDPEDDVAWSPDGSKIAFSSKREDGETSQIYVMDMTMPGEAQKVTTLVTGATGPKWSPDGTQIAFESRVYPGAATDEENAAEKAAREERKYNASAYEIFPIRQWNRWRDDLQTHLFIQDAVAGAATLDLMAGTDFVDQPGYAGVPSLGGESLHPVWTPDGSALVISATVNLDQSAHAPTLYHLYRVSLSRGEPEPITGGREWSCHSAQFGRDGKALYCLFEPATDYAYNPTGIAKLGWPRAQARPGPALTPDLLTAGFDRSVAEMTISKDGSAVYLTAMDEGRVRLYRVRSDGRGGVEGLNPDSGGVYAGPKPAGRSLVARWEDATNPAEVIRIDTRKGEQERLTEFNVARAAELDRPPFREFWFESSSGRRIHSFVALPPDFDENRKYPVITLIHGGPHSSTLDADHIRWSPYVLAAPGYVVVMTDYTGSVGYGVEFSRAIQGDPLETPGNELLEALDEAIRLYPFIDADRQAAAGASYGGHLVNWLQGTTSRFRTLVGHAGLVDLEGQWSTSDIIYHREINAGGPPWGDSPTWGEQSPSSYAGSFSTPMLLTIGEKDFRVPVNQTIAAWSYLKRRQVPGRLIVFHDADHWIMKGAEARHYWEEVHGWLSSYLAYEN